MSILQSLEEGVILPVYKPLEWTSFDVVRKIKALTHRRIKKLKIGHAGTLDPLAEGLLIICTQKMTKQVDAIHTLPKTYIATIVLGANRPSYDKETEISESFPIEHMTREQVEAVLPQFLGKQSQLPPVYSAIKKDGVPMYLMARQGIEVEIKPKEVEIYQIELLSCELPTIQIRVQVSKGTYIRTLAFDIGAKLGVGAFLDHLVRTEVGPYSIDHAQKMSDLESELKG